CELNAAQALAPATRYTVTVAAGITAQGGANLKEQYRWAFTTERPAVKSYSFTTWRSPGTPVVRLVFNQPVTQDTVESALHFGDQASVTATPDPYARVEARRVWLVSPPRELPTNATTALKVVPGLRSYAGPLLGIERRIVVAFDTFPEFRFLGLRCLT